MCEEEIPCAFKQNIVFVSKVRLLISLTVGLRGCRTHLLLAKTHISFTPLSAPILLFGFGASSARVRSLAFSSILPAIVFDANIFCIR